MSAARPRKNYLLPVTFVLYLLTLLLLLSELDRQYYQVGKEEIIKYNFRELFPHDTAKLQALSRTLLLQERSAGGVDAEMLQAWRGGAREMLDGEGCVFRIRIVPKDGAELVAEADHAKFQRLNSFSSTLFYRDFEDVVSYEIAGQGDEPWIGLLSFHYTTPERYAPIVRLTNRYRLLVLLVCALVTGGYALILRMVILPMRRVIGRIDAAAGMRPELMPMPVTTLERAYNDLARDALLLRVTQSLRDVATGDRGLDRGAFLACVPGLLVEMMGYRAALLLELAVGEPDGATVTRCEEAAGGGGDVDYASLCRDALLLPESLAALDGGGPVLLPGVDGCVACDITQPSEQSARTLVALFLPTVAKHDAGMSDWHCQTAARLAEQLREVVAHVDLQRRHLRNERSRANINLARNLGHDLTNIIATSKLDILTVKKILGSAGGEASEDPRTRLLGESVQGLLSNARLLQEVVNLYRSFSYINRPRFESVQINELLDDILTLVELSLPRKIAVEKAYADSLPACMVEPRLLKLAVFNLLTNAVDAIKRVGREDGVITVATVSHTQDEVTIAVRDNGPGICNADGQLASQAEIDDIFRYGVSTRTEEGGEGLGLSWVWTIVEEFHGGRVQARNCPEGGAEFVMMVGVRQNGVVDEDSGS